MDIAGEPFQYGDALMTETLDTGPVTERRDTEARESRNRLANLLDIPPGQLRHLSRETADAMIDTVARTHRDE